MTVTRRIFVSGALATPFLAQLGGAAPANATVATAFSLLDGLSEIRFTESALKRLAAEKIEIQPIAPATALLGADGTTVEGVKLPPEYANGTLDPLGQPVKGSGRLLGGVVLQNAKARVEIVGIRASVPDGRIFAFLKVNDQWIGELPLHASDPSAVRLSVEPGAPGSPTTLKGSGIPITPTPEGADALAKAFGVVLFPVSDTVLTASGTGRAWPVPTLAG